MELLFVFWHNSSVAVQQDGTSGIEDLYGLIVTTILAVEAIARRTFALLWLVYQLWPYVK